MAINQNHLFEELDGIKCAIVEKNALRGRVEFLRSLLTWNGYTVVVVPSPPPKSAPATTSAAPATTSAAALATTSAVAPATTPAVAPATTPAAAPATVSAQVAAPAPVSATPGEEPTSGNPLVPPSVPPTDIPPPPPPAPETYTVGVTDLTFNPTNAIFGRLLRTPEGHIVTLAYWRQQEKESRDEVPYFEA